jgi:hypothetical protein
MKTREISVLVTKKMIDDMEQGWSVGRCDTNEPAIKAKLIIPVEPEVVEFEGVIHQDFRCAAYTGLKFMNSPHDSNSAMQNLQGRRWKCRFEEIL